MDIRQRALQALLLQDPDTKAQAALTLHAQATTLDLDPHCPTDGLDLSDLPGRPQRPELGVHTQMARRSPATLQGRAVLIHAIAHIEFNAINLALDAVWRFDGMPRAYYLDWLSVAADEARHFGMLRRHLQEALGSDYGAFPAHQGLWTMCERTQHDIVARMALVPRLLEARGLDATPQIQAKLRQVGTPDAIAAVALLDVILNDEVGHVAIGNHWYRWLCLEKQLDPEAHYRHLAQEFEAPRPRPPFNNSARLQAGFTASELEWLEQTIQP